jgi:hypothetical protein
MEASGQSWNSRASWGRVLDPVSSRRPNPSTHSRVAACPLKMTSPRLIAWSPRVRIPSFRLATTWVCGHRRCPSIGFCPANQPMRAAGVERLRRHRRRGWLRGLRPPRAPWARLPAGALLGACQTGTWTTSRTSWPSACAEIGALIGELYAIERLVPGPFPGDDAAQGVRRALRQERSRPVGFKSGARNMLYLEFPWSVAELSAAS